MIKSLFSVSRLYSNSKLKYNPFLYNFRRSMCAINDIPFQGIQAKHYIHEPIFQSEFEGIPIYRLLDYDGNVIGGTNKIPFSNEIAVKIMETMLTQSVYDKIFYEIQRQGRISFYMTGTGEEASTVGSGFALELSDPILGQYRELGVFLARGFSLTDILNQLFGTSQEPGKGRQMPIHYTSKSLNIQTISSPLATQISQASGAGYALKMKNEKSIAVTYFGEGAASEGDFSPALNFASTLNSQTLFICRNNGFAISTPVSEQYKGDGIAIRGISYGIKTIRVDGNDVLAVYSAVKKARQYIVENSKPALIELMTYRLSHHSTSDDASRYRSDSEMQVWLGKGLNGISRFRNFLQKQNLWTEEKENEILNKARKELLEEIKSTEALKRHASIDNIFTDVYDDLSDLLKEQMNELKNHVKEYNQFYDFTPYESSNNFPTNNKSM